MVGPYPANQGKAVVSAEEEHASGAFLLKERVSREELAEDK